MSLQAAASHVLTYFPAATAQPPEALGHHGGTSGARIWRVTGYNGPLCLRAWPAATTAEHLSFVHRMLLQAAALPFVPKVCATRSTPTWIQHAGLLWDLTTWMPGAADFADHPSQARLEKACGALAQLHLSWQSCSEHSQPSLTVQRRQERVRAWSEFLASGWRPPSGKVSCDPLHAQVLRAWRVLPPLIQHIPGQLQPWMDYRGILQPCHGDLWHDNVLFQSNTVAGIVDYAIVKQDHIAVDLARLLGSLVPDNAEMAGAGLAAYSAIRPLSPKDQDLVGVLDWTGAVIGAANWLLWLFWEGAHLDNAEGAVRRLDTLLTRLERAKPQAANRR